MKKSESISPEPIRCENCDRVLIERVYLDEKGNTAIDAHGQREKILYDDQRDEHYVECPDCQNRRMVHQRLPTELGGSR